MVWCVCVCVYVCVFVCLVRGPVETAWDKSTIILSSCRPQRRNRRRCSSWPWPTFWRQNIRIETISVDYGGYLANGDRQSRYYYCRHIGSRLSAFEWCIYIWSWTIENMKVKVIQILTYFEYLINSDRKSKYSYCWHIGARSLALEWCIYILTWPILKVKVKVMQILNTSNS